MPDFENLNSESSEENDPLGGIDPMAWLESLAVRQGATEGFTTEHNVDVPEVDPNSVVIDEPGYTPSESLSRSRAESQSTSPPPAPSAYESAPAAAPSGDFGLPEGVDPLAWLEALAARQGATEGFTTDHNVDVPEVDPDSVVIDEPGYTPSESFSRSRATAQQQPVESQPSEEIVPPAEPVYDESAYQQYDYSQYQPPAESAYDGQQYDTSAYPPQSDLYGDTQPISFDQQDFGLPEGVDPLAWLEALAARQGATEGFTTDHNVDVPEIDPNSVVIDEPGYTPSESFSRSRATAQQQPVESQPSEEIAPPAYDEAAYQQPYDPSAYEQYDYSQYQQQDEPSAYQQPAYDESAYYQQPQEALPPAESGIPEGVDPVAWLEALAARQGATEGFTRKHDDITVPEIDPNSVVIDEPGYTPSESFSRREAEPPPSIPVTEPQQPVEASADEIPDWLTETEEEPVSDMSWLDTLAEESGTEVADFLSDMMTGETILPGFDMESMEEETPAAAPPPIIEEAIPPTHTPDEVLASIEGLSDEEIARRQIAGTLTPVQELAWLQRQAMQLAEAREAGEEDYLADIELEPAVEAGELPPWLQSAVVVDEEPETTLAFIDEITTPPAPEDVPDWLREDTSTMELAELELAELVVETPAESRPEEGFLKLDEYDPSLDEWAQALDEEHERIQAGLAEHPPEWYLEAVEKVKSEESFDTELETAVLEPEPAYESPEETPIPDWLAGLSGEPELGIMDNTLDDLPDWLKPMAQQGIAAEDDLGIDDWLRNVQTDRSRSTETGLLSPAPEVEAMPVVETEAEPALASLPPAQHERLVPAQLGYLPQWAQPAVQKVEAPRPAVVTPQPQVRPVAPPVQAVVQMPPRQRVAAPEQPVPPAHPPASVPELAEFAAYRAALEVNPDDHAARLGLARALHGTGDVQNSLNQYQTLVETLGEVENVTSDLTVIAHTNPVARRLLGDVYMRQGYLQEALDAYRGALNNL